MRVKTQKSRGLKKGDHISVDGEPWILIVEDPEPFQCAPDCTIPHEAGDCTTEPHIFVREESRFCVPLSKVSMVFDPLTYIGRKL